jgi:type III pantothenate kinase
VTRRRNPRGLLTIDVGNTRLRAALWRGDAVVDEWNVAYAGSPPWGRRWKRVVEEVQRTGGGKSVHVEVASVAPRRCAVVLRTLHSAGVRSVHQVTHQDRWPFAFDVDAPETVGIDRLANLAGLMAHAVETAVVIDVGTAITIDVLDRAVFRGGVIAPGLMLQAQALHEHTAALPLVTVHGEAPLPARDTRQAIHAGIVYTTVAGTAAVARRLARRLGASTPLYVTGGGARHLRTALRSAHFDPHLLFRGLRFRADRG